MTKMDGSNWLDVLQRALLGIRTMTKDDIGYSSAQMIYGTAIAVPADMITEGGTPREPREITEH